MRRLRTSLALCGLTLMSCQREARRFAELPELSGYSAVTPEGGNQPGMPEPHASALVNGSPNSTLGYVYETNRWAISQGKSLYEKMNCSGCHFHGGGGIGPALMDEKWFYGSSPEAIYTSIVAGRPQGMPSYRGKIVDPQVWQIVAYVRSMSGLNPLDVRPGRDEHLMVTKPESMTEPQKPVTVPHP